MLLGRWITAGLLLCCAMSAAGAQSVFQMPTIFPQHRQALARFMDAARRGKVTEAETAALTGLKLMPKDANWNYNLACLCAASGRIEEGLAYLRAAVECGFLDRAQLAGDRDLAPLRSQPAYQTILARVDELKKAPPTNPLLAKAVPSTVTMGQEATVTEANTQWNWAPQNGGYFETRFALQRPATFPAYKGPHAQLVKELAPAANCAGLLYVNRDEDACQVRYEAFPGLTPVLYGDEALRTNTHRGYAQGLFQDALGAPLPALVNATSILTRLPFWRTLPRALTSDAAQATLAATFAANNQLCLYDATLDLTPKFQGDLLHAHNPAIVATAALSTPSAEGGNAAQRDIAELLLAAYAVMPEATRNDMLRTGRLVPTMQRLLRQHIKGAADYFSAAAHPIAFDPAAIDGEALLRDAAALKPEALPPAFSLSALQETKPVPYVDYFDATGGDILIDTPTCVARTHRTTAKTKSITLVCNAREHGLTYRWFVVQGDPAKVRFNPRTKDLSLMTIDVDWHGARTENDRLLRRVDIACVALRPDGTASAPAFYSLRQLANEARVYDKLGRIDTVDYTPPKEGKQPYEDPALTAAKDWRDIYSYDRQGRLRGWIRLRENAKNPEEIAQDFEPHGLRVVTKNRDESPKTVTRVRYVPRVNQGSDGIAAPAIELLQSDAGTPFEAPKR